PLLEKIDEFLLGGLVRDTEFMQEGVRLSGYLVEDTKQWMSPHRKATLKQEVEQYLKSFMKKVDGAPSETLTPQWLEKELDAFYRLSRNVRYGANLFAILFGIFGLSYLIPKVQYWMTKTLTGKNEHPGIAAALKKGAN
ncbi:MAG: hypothetical protein K2X66_07145, partial [Cyanobacteria bacterium]|nr:hypothetical protein [Cyanobacteriota bacterium]